jgi:OmpA-OmpF porin, OOP family
VNNKLLVCTFALALAGTSGTALAESPSGPGPWYIGVGVGISDANLPDETVNGANSALQAANGASSTVVDTDDQSTSLQIFLGYKFNQNFAVEAGYASLGESTMNADYRSAGVPSTSLGTFSMRYKMTAPYIDAVGILPLGEKWALSGRIGVAYTRTSVDMNGSPLTFVVADSDKSDNKLREKLGAGVEYNLTARATVRAAWDHYKAPDPLSDDSFNVDVGSVSVLFRF